MGLACDAMGPPSFAKNRGDLSSVAEGRDYGSAMVEVIEKKNWGNLLFLLLFPTNTNEVRVLKPHPRQGVAITVGDHLLL